jgi:Tol biopolymer transport system component
MRRLIALASLSAMLVATLGLAGPVRASFPGADGRIVYVDYNLDEDGVIATIDEDGTDRLQLTTGAQSPFGDYEPSWSPGGTLITFTRWTSTSADVWIMNADGTGQKKLTTSSAWDDNPQFSADGSRIVFSTNRNGHFDIYSMTLTGGSLKRLTTSTGDDFDPAWSPDNDRIAFVSGRRGAFELYTMKTDGTGQTRITTTVGVDYDDNNPEWHPDGDSIAFMRFDANQPIWYLLTMGEGGGAVDAIRSNATPFGFGVYAPSSDPATSERIVYHEKLGDDAYDLDVIDLDTKAITDVTAFPGVEVSASWQAIPEFPLIDAKFSPFETYIEWAYAEGITAGCSAERYCPDANVTRAQMAIFLDRALGLPPTATDFFSDDNGKTGEASINRLAASGITGGCAPGKFCPTASVTRGQMAAFLDRAFSLPATSTDYFSDDETSTFERSINRVAAAGITGGCGGGKYCPLANVTRGQMAAFLSRALD